MTKGKTLLTAEQLFELPDDGCHRYELLDGELVEMTPPGGEHGGVTAQVSRQLLNFSEDAGLDFLIGSDVGVILRRNPDRVRAPDVFAIARHRLPEGRLPKSYLTAVPDLVVEIVSPNDRAFEVQEKVEEWLRAGARLVWVCYPSTRMVAAHRDLTGARTFRIGEMLDAEPILPGFAIPVERIFA